MLVSERRTRYNRTRDETQSNAGADTAARRTAFGCATSCVR